MKPSSFIFVFFVTGSVISSSISNIDKCSGRWQTTDQLNIKLTLGWQISKADIIDVEFRINPVEEGFWYGFKLVSSSTDNPATGLAYTVRWCENDTQSCGDIYNVTESNVTIVKQNDSSLVTYPRSSSSSIITVQSQLDLSSLIIKQSCLYIVYMRGRLTDDIPLIPDEILFNKSLCLTCPRYALKPTNTYPTAKDITTESTIMSNTINQISYTFTTEDSKSSYEAVSASSSFRPPLTKLKTELTFFWFGRIINRLWSNDFFNLNSDSSNQLRLELQDLFLFLIHHNSSFPFVCDRFSWYLLKSGSILFASNITLISSLPENQTINVIEKLIKTVTDTEDFHLSFDLSAHFIKRANESLEINDLVKKFSTKAHNDRLQKEEMDASLHVLFVGIVSLGCLLILITTILCLYGYYKCRRRQFRLITERQTLKFKHNTNTYTWLGQQPSISSSPYLIQSTSI